MLRLWKSWHFWRRALPALAILVLCGWGTLFLTVRWLGRDRDYTFIVHRVSDPETVRMTVGMVGELQRVRSSTEESLQPAVLDVLLQFVRLPANQNADSWSAMLRSTDPSSGPATGEGDLRGRLALINGLITQLDSSADAPSPRELVALPGEEAQARLRAFFASSLASEQIRLWDSILDRAPWPGLVRRHQWPEWPKPDVAPWTTWARRRLGKPDLRIAWVEGLTRDVAQLEELGHWYDDLERIERLALPRSTSTGLFLRRPRGNGGAQRSIRSANHDEARMDFEVWYEFATQAPPPQPLDPLGPDVANRPGDASGGNAESNTSAGVDPSAVEHRSIDTGLRLVDVKLRRPATRGADPEPELDPETTVVVEADALNPLLTAMGSPEAFVAVDLVPSRRWSQEPRAFAVDLKMRHRLLSGVSHQATLVLNVADQPPLGDAIAQLSKAVLQKLDELLPKLTQFEGWPARIEPTKEAGLFRLQLEPPQVGSMSGMLRRTEQGHVVWSDASTLAQRQRLVSVLTTQSEPLRPLASVVTVEALQFDVAPPTRLRGRLNLRLREMFPGVADIKGIAWVLDASGNGTVELPPGFDLEKLQALAQKAKERREQNAAAANAATNSGVRRWTAEDIAQAVHDELKATYGKIADSVEVPLPVEGPDGFVQMLGLKLADWPELNLGPQPIKTPQEAAAAVHKLLSKENVLEQSKEQWTNTGAHPRRGPAKVELTDWSPTEGIARLLCKLPIHGNLAASWTEQLVAEAQGLWDSLDEEEIQEKAEEVVDEVEEYVKGLALSEMGLDLEAGIDRNGFGLHRWLRFNPPGIALRGAVRPFAVVPLRVGLNRVLLDMNGLQLGKSEGLIERPTTIVVPTPAGIPAIALSDPRLEFDVARKALLAGVKCTPPLPPGMSKIVRSALPVGTGSPEVQEQMSALGMQGAPPSSTWRLDNPWINLAYVDSAVGFGFRDSDARGKGGIKLFNKHDAAQGDVSLYVKHLGVEGQVRGKKVPYVPVPTVNGQVSVNKEGRGGFDMNSEFELAGVKSHLKMSYPRADVPESERLLRTDGAAKVPVLGYVRLKGVTDPGFRNPSMQARGKIDVLGQPVTYILSVDRKGFNVDYEWTTPDGRKMTYKAKGTTLDEAAGERMAQGLADAIRKGRGKGRGLSEAEAALVRQLPNTTPVAPAWTEPDSKSDPVAAEKRKRKMFAVPGRAPVQETDMQVKVFGDRVQITRKSTQRLLVDLPLSDLNLASLKMDQIEMGVKFTVWDPADSQDAAERVHAVLAVDYYSNRLVLRRLSDVRTVSGSPDSLASELSTLTPLFPDETVSDAGVRALANRQAMITCASLKLDQVSLSPARNVGSNPVVWIEWSETATESEAGTSTGEVIRIRSGMLIDVSTNASQPARIQRTYFYDWLVPPDRWPQATASLASVESPAPADSTALLAIASNAGSSRPALLWEDLSAAAASNADAQSGERKPKAYLATVEAPGPNVAPLKIEISPELDPVTQLSAEQQRSILRLQQLIVASWTRGPSLAGAFACAGPEGIVAVVTESVRPGWWLSPARATIPAAEIAEGNATEPAGGSAPEAAGSAPAPVFLDRPAWVAWKDAESRVQLPGKLQTPEARAEVDDVELAWQLVRPWPVHRGVWGAHPMALVLRLAR